MRCHKRKPTLTEEIRKIVKDARVVLVVDEKGVIHVVGLEDERVISIKEVDLESLRVKRLKKLIPLSLLRFEGSDCWIISDGGYVNICDE